MNRWQNRKIHLACQPTGRQHMLLISTTTTTTETSMAKKNTCTYAVAALLFLGGLGYLLYSGFSENSTYFLNVAEAQTMDPSKLHNIRLFGTVGTKGIERPSDLSGVSFDLEDKDVPSKKMRISYKGIVPDSFKEKAEVIVEGSLAADGSFAATSLMTKCPSKYQKQNRPK